MWRIGTAGWSLSRQWLDHFPRDGSHLERYASRFSAAEINSSFWRQHRRSTYARWAAAVPESFRFSVKLPRAITHEQRLIACDVLLEVFLEEAGALGARLGPLLVQLPPSLAFDAGPVDEFFSCLRSLHPGDVVCEPRHASWFDVRADALLERRRVARAGADPSCVDAAAVPGGWTGLPYLRLHGSPRMYYSAYDDRQLAGVASVLERALARARTVSPSAAAWCMFDNTTLGAATGNALELQRILAADQGREHA